MKSKITSFIFALTSYRLYASLVLLFVCYFPVSAQYELSIKQQSAEEILKALSDVLEVRFNFSHENLPNGKFTFSCSGTAQKLFQITSSVLDRRLVQLDEKVFTIQKNKLDAEEKIPAISIKLQIINIAGETLGGTVVWIPALYKAFDTDKDGRVEIKGYFSEQEKLEFRYLGYITETKTIAELMAASGYKLVLKEQQHMLSQIVVRSPTRSKNFDLNAMNDVLLPNKMTTLAGRADTDVLSMVQLLPGMYSADESVSEIQTRGGPPDQTNLEWNGIQVFQTNHFYGNISSINPIAVDRIEVVKNGASAEGSGQASGTITMQDSNHFRDSLWGKVHSNLLYSNVGMNIPLIKRKLQIRFAWRQSYTQFLESDIYNRIFDNSFQFGKLSDQLYYREFYDLEDLISLTPTMSFQDLFASIKVDLSKKDFLKISGAQIKNEFVFVRSGEILDSSPEDNIDYQNQGLSLNYRREWSDKMSSVVQLSTSKFDHENRYLEDPRLDSVVMTDEQIQTNGLEHTSWSFTQTYEQEKLKLSAGILYEEWDYELSERARSGSSEVVYYEEAFKAHERSAFVQALWKASAFWQLEGGLRYSDYSLGENDYWEPRIHLSVFPADRLSLHAHLGWYHQALNKKNLFSTFHVDNGYWYLSNESEIGNYVHVVENDQISIGAKYQLKQLSFGLDVYRKRSQDLWTSAFDFDVNVNPYLFADLDVVGAELSLNYQSKHFSLLWTYDRVDEELIYETGVRSNSPFSQAHRISLFQAFQWKRWQLSLHWRYASGRYFSLPERLVTHERSDGSVYYSIDYQELLTEQLPDYHSLDISVLYKFGRTNGKISGHVACSIRNAYNRANVIKNEFFVDYRPEIIQISLHPWTGLPLLPNLTIELDF